MNRTRIYVFLGTADSLFDMMTSMESIQLFSKGEYMIIYVDTLTYSPRDTSRYFWKNDILNKLTTCDIDKIRARARSLLVVISTPPKENYEIFTTKVREYNAKEPFNFTTPNVFQNFQRVNLLHSFLYLKKKLTKINLFFQFLISLFRYRLHICMIQ